MRIKEKTVKNIKWLILLFATYVSTYVIIFFKALRRSCQDVSQPVPSPINCADIPKVWDHFFEISIRNGFVHFLSFVAALVLCGLGYSFFIQITAKN